VKLLEHGESLKSRTLLGWQMAIAVLVTCWHIVWTSMQESSLNGFVDSKSKGAWCIILASLSFTPPTVYLLALSSSGSAVYTAQDLHKSDSFNSVQNLLKGTLTQRFVRDYFEVFRYGKRFITGTP
jgi:hypothetical protein